MRDIVTNTIGKDVIKLVEKNGKFQLLHNDKKISEVNDLSKAVKKCDEYCEPLLIEWYKKNGVKSN
jgi:hypothetical protein